MMRNQQTGRSLDRQRLQARRMAGRAFAASPLLVGAMLLGGCTTAVGPVDVTRFHQQSVAQQGSISVVPGNPADANSLEFRTTANAVSAALARTGFSTRDSGGQYEAVVELWKETLVPGATRSPISVGVGGSTGGFGSGVGLGIGINLAGKPKPIIATRMRVQLRRAGTQEVFWEGRAETQAKTGSPAAQPGIAAGRLADALFQGFPGQSGETITVK